MQQVRKCSSRLLVLTLVLTLAGTGWAQTTITFTNATGTQSFDTAGNWDPNQVPSGTNDIAVFDQAAAYQVDFNQNESNGILRVEAGTVTFNLNGYTYNAGLSTNGSGAYSDTIRITNGATLLVTGGGALQTMKFGSYDYGLTIAGGSSLIVTGGSQVVDRQITLAYQYSGINFREGSSVLVTGPGSELHNWGYYNANNASMVIEDGGLYWDHRQVQTDSSSGVSNQTWVVRDPGSKLISAGALRSNYGGLLDLTVTDGGEAWLGAVEMTGGGVRYPENQMTVGGPGAASLIVVSNQVRLSTGWDLWGAVGHVTVASNGTMRIIGTGATGDRAIYIGDGDGFYDPTSSVNIDGGTLQINTNKIIDIQQDDQPATGYAPTLRGAGTISKYNAGANFSIANSGVIRVGDTGWGTNNIAGLGVLNIVGGDLYQTNTAATARMYFEFSDTALDQIVLNGGMAQITTGSNWFNLASGSVAPVPGVKWGLGAYNFIVGSNITYSPQYDNLTNVLAAYGLTQDLDYRWGVMNLGGGLQALRLEFVPEPSTVLLLLGGGLLLYRFRRRA